MHFVFVCVWAGVMFAPACLEVRYEESFHIGVCYQSVMSFLDVCIQLQCVVGLNNAYSC